MRYTVPTTIDTVRMADKTIVRFRVTQVYKDQYINVYINGTRIQHKKKRIMAPGEMEQVILNKAQLAEYPNAELTIAIEPEQA